MEIDQNIYEPLDLFRSRFKDEHAKNVSDFFEDLVKKSGVDEAKNADTVSKIKDKQKAITAADKSLAGKKTLRGFIIFLIVAFAIAAIVLFYMAFENGTSAQFPSWLAILLGVVALLGIVGWSLLIGLKINKIIKKGQEIVKGLNDELNVLLKEAWTEMKPLNDLYDWGMTQGLVEKTIPLVKMDPYFDNQRFEFMAVKYGLEDNSALDHSVTFVQSGEIIGNPFILARTVNTWMGTKVYIGTLEISWTESRYENGKWVTETRYQTLTASVTKPLPCYGGKTFIIYGNEAAPDLSFSRGPSGANGMNDHEIQKFVQKKGKEIEKMSEKAVTSGSSFTAMAETDFESLFGALDRDNEVQFRLLFTPLAQRELMNLIKDKEAGYGDDWSFVKRKCLNYLEPAHLSGADMTGNPNTFVNYDLAAARKIFYDYNNNYFREFYFAMAPLFAIPLYEQQKPHEYIYRNILHSNVSCWEHESIANQFSADVFKSPESVTTNILKTHIVASSASGDEVTVTSYGYKGIPRVDMVPMLGGDGKMHLVPVPWVEYIPVSKTSDLVVQKADKLNQATYLNNQGTNPAWAAYFKNVSQATVYRQALIAFIATRPLDAASLDQLGNIVGKAQ
jgi:hypothetical protein